MHGCNFSTGINNARVYLRRKWRKRRKKKTERKTEKKQNTVAVCGMNDRVRKNGSTVSLRVAIRMWLFNGSKSRKTIKKFVVSDSLSLLMQKKIEIGSSGGERYLTMRRQMPQYESSFMNFLFPLSLSCVFSGSLPPSPADSGVSDVDSSSSGGQTCSDELKARLGLPSHCPPQNHVPPGPFLNPNYYHNSPPLRNIWSNRSVTCKYSRLFFRLFFFSSYSGRISVVANFMTDTIVLLLVEFQS